MNTNPSHILFHQRNERERKILKNKAFIDAFGSPSQIKKKSGSKSSKSSSNTLNTPGHQSSEEKTKTSTLKIISNNEAYKDRLVPNIELLVKRYPRFKTLPTTIIDLPDALLRNIMIKANLQNKYVLRSWIHIEHLDVGALCLNPNAISFLTELYKLPKKDYDILAWNKKINWGFLSRNPNAMYLIKKQILYEKTLTNEELAKIESMYKIHWNKLSSNPNAIDVLKHKIEEEKTQGDIKIINYRKIDWNLLSSNPNAIPLLKANEEKIVWNEFYLNKNLDIELFEKKLLKILNGEEEVKPIDWNIMWSIPISNAINLLIKYFPEKIDYFGLSRNKCSAAIKLLLANKKNINWKNLSANTHPKAIKLLEANIKKIDWIALAENTNKDAIKIIENNIVKLPAFDIDRIWYYLSINPKAIKLLEDNPTEININQLYRNPNAVKLIKKSNDTFYYSVLCENPCIFSNL